MSEKQNHNKILLLFDIDGTILSLKGQKSKELFQQLFFERYEILIDLDQFPNFSGMTDLLILKYLCDISGINYNFLLSEINEVWEHLSNLFDDFFHHTYFELKPGIIELLDAIECENIFVNSILTGNFEDNAIRKLKVFNLSNRFLKGAYGNNHIERNQLPMFAFENIYNQLKIDFQNDRCLIIGDSPQDIHVAKANNFKVLSVCTGSFSMKDLEIYKPDLIFEDLSNTQILLDSIKELFKN